MTTLQQFEHTLKPQLQLAVNYIKRCQREDGAILWYPGARLDPWDHTEAAMALSIGGDFAGSLRAFEWLQLQQHSDGSWSANYFESGSDTSTDPTKVETNFVAYPATGLWHHYKVFQNKAALQRFFPMVRSALDFVVAQQYDAGDIQWALSQQETLPKDALVTACSSILRSFECALNIANTLGQKQPHWQNAYLKLYDALRNKPWRFDRTWESKSRFSMDWFYPILAGLFSPEEARHRLQSRWQDFVRPDLGCRCVNDEPWVTVAESCELVLACVAAEQTHQAHDLFRWLSQWQDKDGGFWTGYSYRDKVIWPHEKTSWTAGAYLLAADALFKITPAAALLTTPSRVIGRHAVTPPANPPAL